MSTVTHTLGGHQSLHKLTQVMWSVIALFQDIYGLWGCMYPAQLCVVLKYSIWKLFATVIVTLGVEREFLFGSSVEAL